MQPLFGLAEEPVELGERLRLETRLDHAAARVEQEPVRHAVNLPGVDHGAAVEDDREGEVLVVRDLPRLIGLPLKVDPDDRDSMICALVDLLELWEHVAGGGVRGRAPVGEQQQESGLAA